MRSRRGWASAACLAIAVVGLTAMAPQRRGDIVSLGPKTIASGTLATCLIGAIVGMITSGSP